MRRGCVQQTELHCTKKSRGKNKAKNVLLVSVSLDISLNLQCLTPLQSIFSELYQSQIPFSLSFRLKRIGHGDPPFCSSFNLCISRFQKEKKKNCAFLKTQFFIIYIFFLSFSFFTFFFFPCIYIYIYIYIFC